MSRFDADGFNGQRIPELSPLFNKEEKNSLKQKEKGLFEKDQLSRSVNGNLQS